jgi:hypothetical protein
MALDFSCVYFFFKLHITLFIYLLFFIFIYMCIHCLGHLSPCSCPPHLPPCLASRQTEPVLFVFLVAVFSSLNYQKFIFILSLTHIMIYLVQIKSWGVEKYRLSASLFFLYSLIILIKLIFQLQNFCQLLFISFTTAIGNSVENKYCKNLEGFGFFINCMSFGIKISASKHPILLQFAITSLCWSDDVSW